MKPVFLASLTILGLTVAIGRAQANPLERELVFLAEEVAKAMGKVKQHVSPTIRVGKFTGNAALPSGHGPEIARILVQELTKRNVKVDPKAPIEISGEYRPADQDPADPRQKETYIRINPRLVNTRTGQPLKDVELASRAVYGNGVLAETFAVPGSVSPGAGREERNHQIRKHMDQPDSHVDGAMISSLPGSPFRVEILVVERPDAPNPARGREAVKKDGLAYVRIGRNEFYRVKITNTADFDVAVKLSIDGLDQFVFSNLEMTIEEGDRSEVLALRDSKTSKPRYNFRIVPRGQSVVIAGWFRDLKHFDYFVVTDFAKSAVAELKASAEEVGQIVVQFHACWEKEADRPADEKSLDRSAEEGTGRSPGGRHDLRDVQRTIGVLRDTVPVRYSRDGR